jgi:hypothetical protein
VDPKGLRLRGCRIDGRLDLRGIQTNVKLDLQGCYLPYGVNLYSVQMPELVLAECLIAGITDPPIEAPTPR